MSKKEHHIRLCDNNFLIVAVQPLSTDWDIITANSDAKCYYDKRKWNSKHCLKCVYNDCFDMREIKNIRDLRKLKLIQIKREAEFGKTKPGNHYGTYGYVEPTKKKKRC